MIKETSILLVLKIQSLEFRTKCNLSIYIYISLFLYYFEKHNNLNIGATTSISDLHYMPHHSLNLPSSFIGLDITIIAHKYICSMVIQAFEQ